MIGVLDDEAKEFLKQYTNYLSYGCPPPTKYVSPLAAAVSWQDNGMNTKDAPVDSLLDLLEYAVSTDMGFELGAVSGQEPKYASELAEQIRGLQ